MAKKRTIRTIPQERTAMAEQPPQQRALAGNTGQPKARAGTGQHRGDGLLAKPCPPDAAHQGTRLHQVGCDRGGTAIGGNQFAERRRAQFQEAQHLWPVSAQVCLQAVEPRLVARLTHPQARQPSVEFPPLLTRSLPQAADPLQVQPPDQLGGLGIVQTRYPIVYLGRVMHPLGTDSVDRDPAPTQLLDQRIPIGPTRLEHNLQDDLARQPAQAPQHLRCLPRMLPIEGDPHPRIGHQHRCHKVLLGHIYRQHRPTPAKPLRQPRPVHPLELYAAVSTLAHGDTSNVSVVNTTASQALAGPSYEGPHPLFYN